MPASSSRLSDQHRQELVQAAENLASQPLAIRLANRLGTPLEGGLKRLPAPAVEALNEVTHRAIERAASLAVRTLPHEQDPFAPPRAHRIGHQIATGLTGAAGGALGLPGFLAELPVTTTLMLRSIADIAREHGEPLSEAETRLQCVSIFAWGSPEPADDATETSWLATRQLLAGSIRRATRHIAQHGLTARGAPALARFVSIVASRFSATAAEKLALQMVPVIGAVTGASINTIFVRYYQQIADAHFTLRRLERLYGEHAVQEELHRLAEFGSVR